ncbi:MAG: hypothetical protein WCF22_15540 [Candidatus Sulfotelmatobacter sp.]
MPTKLHCQIIAGFTPNEKIARIQGADGKFDEVVVSKQNIEGNKLLASEIGRDAKGKVLIELPRESTSGRWRMWVNASSVGG